MTTEVQAIVFKTDSPNKWTKAKSMKWLKENGFSLLKGKTVDVTENSLRYRINDPKRYIRFITKVGEGDFGAINFIIGTRSLASEKKKKRRRRRKRNP